MALARRSISLPGLPSREASRCSAKPAADQLVLFSWMAKARRYGLGLAIFCRITISQWPVGNEKMIRRERLFANLQSTRQNRGLRDLSQFVATRLSRGRLPLFQCSHLGRRLDEPNLFRLTRQRRAFCGGGRPALLCQAQQRTLQVPSSHWRVFVCCYWRRHGLKSLPTFLIRSWALAGALSQLRRLVGNP